MESLRWIEKAISPTISPMPILRRVRTAVPPHRVEQGVAKQFAEAFFGPRLRSTRRLLPVFDHAGVESRYFSRPPEWFRTPRSFAEKNQAHLEEALALTESACQRLLDSLALDPGSVDAIYLVNSTGLATPTLDARLVHRLGLSRNIRRIPIWGLGCAGGVAGLAMALHHVAGHPRERVLLVAVELCGLTFLSDDASKANLVASALFGEGAAAALIDGDDVPDAAAAAGTRATDGLRFVDSQSTHYPDSLDVMGWHVVDEGLQVVFAESIPAIVRRESRAHVEELLSRHELRLDAIEQFLFHPGGTKVIEAYREALGIESPEDRDTDAARPSGTGEARYSDRLGIPVSILRDYGNMSSVTALFVIERYLEGLGSQDRKTTGPGHLLVSALGPGFSAESVLLRR